jgi:hypothetical protein
LLLYGHAAAAAATSVLQAGDWLVQYDPYKPVYPPNLFAAQRSTQSRRLRLPKAQSSLPTAALLNKPLTS